MATTAAGGPVDDPRGAGSSYQSRIAAAALIAFPLAKLAIHIAAAGRYGYFRDELYYLACSHRLAWGYIDHPALSIAALRLWTSVAGESAAAIRLAPALLGAVTVLLTGLMVRTLDGGAFAASLAMLCVVVAPQYLGVDGFYSMNSFDVLIWTLAGYLLVRILHAGEERLWPLLGLTLGLGLNNKISVLWLGAGIGAGLLICERKRLASRGPWLALAIAFGCVVPLVLWQVQHDWPTLEFIRGATEEKMASIRPLDFVGAQVINMHPLTAPVWIAGLYFSLATRACRKLRLIGVVYLTVLALLVVNEKSRTGYLAPAYPILLALGAVWFAGRLQRRVAWLRPVSIALIALGGIVTAPLALHILTPEAYAAYSAFLGVKPSTEEHKELDALPQFVADFFGWPELVEKVVAAHESLSPEERARATLFTGNYGEAGAIEVLGSGRGLPPVTSGHNNYWLWGPGPRPADPIIAVLPADSLEGLQRRCSSMEDRGPIGCRHCMPYERDSHVIVCRGPRRALSEAWPDLKHYD